MRVQVNMRDRNFPVQYVYLHMEKKLVQFLLGYSITRSLRETVNRLSVKTTWLFFDAPTWIYDSLSTPPASGACQLGMHFGTW